MAKFVGDRYFTTLYLTAGGVILKQPQFIAGNVGGLVDKSFQKVLLGTI